MIRRAFRLAAPAALAALGLALASCGAPAPHWPLTIVADPGRFGSIEQAAAAADSVDWWDAATRDDDACTESYAATELARFLPRALGVDPAEVRLAAAGDRLPDRGDVIVVGPALAKRLGHARPLPDSLARTRPDAYRLTSEGVDGRTLTCIEGATRSGTLAGAYGLLDRLGVRFHLPGDSCVAYPVKPARLPRLATLEVPAFDLRGFWAWEPRGNDDFFRWMARNQFNLWTAAEPDPARLAMLGVRLTDGGHALEEEFLDPAHNFAKHPDWFGFENGKRHPGIRGETGLNFCTSNPGARAEFARRLVASLVSGRYRHADVLQVWPLDTGRWCTCEACTAQGNAADRWLVVVAEAADSVAAAERDGRLSHPVRLMMPAYLETATPPTRPVPASLADDDVEVVYLPYFRCYAHPLGDPLCTEINRGLAARFVGWLNGRYGASGGAMAIGEYYNVSWVKSLPVVMTKVMAADLSDYATFGVRDFFYMHAPTRRFGPWALDHAVLRRLLWSPHRDLEGIVDDFVAHEYPGVEREMKAFYTALEHATSNFGGVEISVGAFGTAENARLLDPKLPIFPLHHLGEQPPQPGPNAAADLDQMEAAMREARAFLDAARAKARGPRVIASLRDVEDRFAYGEDMLAFWTALLRGAVARRAGDAGAFRTQMARADSAATRLRTITDLVHVSASHSNAKDGLEASGAVREYEAMRALAKEGTAP